MPSFTTTAPGKMILFGEHAVVYGRPAIAAPVTGLRARAIVSPEPRSPAGAIRIQAPDIQLDSLLSDLSPEQPLRYAVEATLTALGVQRPIAFTLRVTSTIPVASGLGSGAAVSVAVIRTVSAFLGHPLPNEKVSDLAYEVEKLHHGTPSGIDNTVITYEKPVFFQRRPEGNLVETFSLRQTLPIVIGDTGVRSPTSIPVGDVRRAWQAHPETYEPLFDAVGRIVMAARQAIEQGQTNALGPLMNQNQELLRQMGVSSPELERLITTAHQAGALGAKLSGGGRGGIMLALVPPERIQAVEEALLAAGAVFVSGRVGERGRGRKE